MVNQVAFGTVTSLGLITIASAVKAASVVTTTAAVGYAILGVGLASASIGSMTAWYDSSSTDVKSYFRNVRDHSGIAVSGMVQLIAQTMIQTIIQMTTQGIGIRVSEKILRSFDGQKA